jgi:hypothetical protein
MTADPWALLREARTHIVEVAVQGCDDRLLARIDAALAERQDSATDVVEWKRMNGRAFMSALIGRCDVDLFSKEGGGWWWQVRANGDEKTIDEAKSAAIAAARGMR